MEKKILLTIPVFFSIVRVQILFISQEFLYLKAGISILKILSAVSARDSVEGKQFKKFLKKEALLVKGNSAICAYSIIKRLEDSLCTKIEFKDMELGDGAIKIFLNMQSLNGNKDLVDLLQYMKDFKFLDEHKQEMDARIIDLDELANEVKGSVEWEDTQMTILEKGEKIGENKKLMKQAVLKYAKGLPANIIAEHLEITEDEAAAMIEVIQEFPDATVEELLEAYWSRNTKQI